MHIRVTLLVLMFAAATAGASDRLIPEAITLQDKVLSNIGRAGLYDSDLSVVMTNFGHVAHLIFTDTHIGVVYLDGGDTFIFADILDHLEAGGVGERKVTIYEYRVNTVDCVDLLTATNKLTEQFEKSLRWVPSETGYGDLLDETGQRVIMVDGADYEIRARIDEGFATIRPYGGNRSPLYLATHEFFIVTRNCARQNAADNSFEQSY